MVLAWIFCVAQQALQAERKEVSGGCEWKWIAHQNWRVSLSAFTQGYIDSVYLIVLK